MKIAAADQPGVPDGGRTGSVSHPSCRRLPTRSPPSRVNVQNAGPRAVEDTTQRSVARDYAAAWKAMAEALDQNRTDVLALNFTGTANDKLTATIAGTT